MKEVLTLVLELIAVLAAASAVGSLFGRAALRLLFGM